MKSPFPSILPSRRPPARDAGATTTTAFGEPARVATMERRPEPLRDRIARRAYELWENEGRPPGQDQRHWLLAEEEILAPDSSFPSPQP